MKDNFSYQSDKYAQYRPTYPMDLFEYLNSIVSHKRNAWDVGTGNGQFAYELAKTFENVFATDISESQIKNSFQADNIKYSVQPAEKTNFNNNQFDLIVVAQAIHWFDFEKFYEEVRRTANQDAFIFVVGYGRLEISDQIDHVISYFYHNIIGSYWDKERRFIDQNYLTIPFPFTEIEPPKFRIKMYWTLEHLIGYLNTWSAVKHFIKKNGYNPVDEVMQKIERHWEKEEVREVCFPLLLRMGKVK
ncbi:MAG: class I SAM-dependent methyltransferase [Cytophagaceae bacterium]